jgi:hypothetical protein
MNNPNQLFYQARSRSGVPVAINEIKTELVELYARARDGDHEAKKQFHRLIGYRPWMISPLAIDMRGPPPSLSSADRPDYDRMCELRRQLDEAIAAR